MRRCLFATPGAPSISLLKLGRNVQEPDIISSFPFALGDFERSLKNGAVGYESMIFP